MQSTPDPSSAKTRSSSTGVLSSSGLSRSELYLLLILAGVQVTHIMDFMILMPLGPLLMRVFEITPQQFSLIVSSYSFAAGVFGFFGAFFVDRFDRKKALIFCYIGFTLGTLACGIAPSYTFLLLARSLAGTFGGILGALILSVVGDAIPNARRGRAMGIVMASFSVASVVGVPFGLYLATLISWHAPFLLIGGVAGINVLLMYFRIPSMKAHLDPTAKRTKPLALISAVLNDRNQVTALSFTILLMLSQFTLIPFLSPYMVANVGFREDQLPYIYLIGGGLTIFSSPLVGRLADRIGKSKVFTIAAFLVLIPYVVITHLGPTPLEIALIFTGMFFVLGNARFIPAMAMVTSTVRPQTRGSFMSFNSCVQSLSMALAAQISGYIVQKSPSGSLEHYNYVGYLAVGISLIAIWVGRKLVAIDD